MPAVKLLSSPAIFLGEDRAIPPKGKTSALLYYLAYQADWVQRDDLLYLFWPDFEEQKARRNLRQLLSSLRTSQFGEYLKTNKQHVGWFVPTDVKQFKEALNQEKWLDAIEHYEGELLQGFRSSNIPEFEKWLEFERVDLFRLYRKTVLAFSHELELNSHFDQATDLVERLNQFDPLDEEVFRYYLKLFILSGKQEEAGKAYQQFSKLLGDLGAEPEASTAQLVNQINAGTSYEKVKEIKLTEMVAPHLLKMPTPATQFVGRELELSQVMARLRDPACRLLTIIAAGGMGKTRLAIEAAKRLESDFKDGICFIPFEPVSSAELMVSAIAAAVEFSFFGQQDPKSQLFNYLKDKHLLLVADNLEHLLEDSQIFSELLEIAPSLSILVTSRIHLNLHAEWVFDLAGMSFQEDDQANDALILFEQSAKKARSNFSLENNHEAVTSICQQTGGMPLAIELAASWLRVLSVQEIADDLQKDINILAGSLKDIPKRHQDVQNIFETSWHRLKPEEQTALLGLSIFQGGFDKKAAKEVAEVNPLLLLGLSNKSFLYRDDAGRFTQHPLLWQFVRKKVENHPSFANFQEKHATYFAFFLKMREASQEDLEVVPIQQEITVELANILTAWHWMSEQHREDLLEKALWSLCEYYRGINRFQEGDLVFSQAAAELSKKSLIRARLLHRLAIFNNLLGDYKKSAALLSESLAISQHLKASWDEAHALYVWGINQMMSSGGNINNKDYIATLNKSALLFNQHGDKYYEARVWSQLPETPDALEYEERLLKCIGVFRETQGYFGLSLTLTDLAEHVAQTRGAFDEALGFIEEAVTIERKRNNSFRLSWCLNLHGYISKDVGEYQLAQQSFEESLAISKRYFSGASVFKPNRPLYGLGWLACAQEEYEQAQIYWLEALDYERQFEPPLEQAGVMNALCEVATILKNFDIAKSYCAQISHILDSTQEHGAVWVEVKRDYLHNLAKLALEQNKPEEAEIPLQEALSSSQKWQAFLHQLEILVTYSDLFRQQGNVKEAAQILILVTEHKGCLYSNKKAALKRFKSIPNSIKKEMNLDLTLEVIVKDLLSSKPNITEGVQR